MPHKHLYRLTSHWGESVYVPSLSVALDELNTPLHCNDFIEHWLKGAWVKVEV